MGKESAVKAKALSMRFGWIWLSYLATLGILMQEYFIRRLLLIPPTLFGITILVFAITRFAPGGPMERALMEMQQMNVAGGTSLDGM